MSLDPRLVNELRSSRFESRHRIVQVALAARCARHVEPIFHTATASLQGGDPKFGPVVVEPVLVALRAVEAVARAGGLEPGTAMYAVHAAAKAASREIRDRRCVGFPDHPARWASACVTYAARAARDYLDNQPCFGDVCNTVETAVAAAPTSDRMIGAIVSDLRGLSAGTLRPNGAPPEWPDVTPSGSEPCLDTVAGPLLVSRPDITMARRRLALILLCLEWLPTGKASKARLTKMLNERAGRRGAGFKSVTRQVIIRDIKALETSVGSILVPSSSTSDRSSRFADSAGEKLRAAERQYLAYLRVGDAAVDSR